MKIRCLPKFRTTHKLIGNVLNTKVWLDDWILQNLDFRPAPSTNARIDSEQRVNDLLFPNIGNWDMCLPSAVFDQQTTNVILKLTTSSSNMIDELSWLRRRDDSLSNLFIFKTRQLVFMKVKKTSGKVFEN